MRTAMKVKAEPTNRQRAYDESRAKLQMRISELERELAYSQQAYADGLHHIREMEKRASDAEQQNKALHDQANYLNRDIARVNGMIEGWREIGLIPKSNIQKVEWRNGRPVRDYTDADWRS